ncbi:efflux RND transporter periplasmic adaptor subunit [Pannonibacter sp.]|uniref:efflux RND transporter periplasmic adaptor subunit n=1 Tax=Pannonibacter sp. TaxID=1906786 RepID=UPI003F7081CF
MKPTLITLTMLGTAAMLAGCQDEHEGETAPVRPVLSIAVAPQQAQTTGFAGTVEARYSSDLGFRVLGRIVSRDVNVGERVKKGQRLAALDPLTFELAVRSAKADLASASARLENGKAAERRLRKLLQQDVANQAQFDDATQALETARADVIRARAYLAKADEQLGYSELLANFDGVVTDVSAELGQVVQPGQTVVSVARPDLREAVVDLPETIGRNLPLQTRFEIALQVDPSLRVSGLAREIAPQADATTRTRRVKITLDAPPERFRLGSTVTATLAEDTAPGIELPATALLERDGKTMVWVVNPATQTVSLKDLTVIARDSSSIWVRNDIADGTRIVTAGVNSLTANQKVKLTDGAFQ